MIANISKKLTDRLLLKSVIEQDSWEIYYFGIYKQTKIIMVWALVISEAW